jgi:hypothetical protein
MKPVFHAPASTFHNTPVEIIAEARSGAAP